MRLILVGGCRNKEDEERVAELKRIVADLDLTNHVIFEVNVRDEGFVKRRHPIHNFSPI